MRKKPLLFSSPGFIANVNQLRADPQLFMALIYFMHMQIISGTQVGKCTVAEQSLIFVNLQFWHFS